AQQKGFHTRGDNESVRSQLDAETASRLGRDRQRIDNPPRQSHSRIPVRQGDDIERRKSPASRRYLCISAGQPVGDAPFRRRQRFAVVRGWESVPGGG